MNRRIAWLMLIVFLPSAVSAADPDFAIDVMSVLSKAGCNAGACHGNLNGKGGLKLSLRGQDASFDYQSLVLSSRGRRINCSAPELSLLLKKATGAEAHVGGSRFALEAPEYQVLHHWIADGAPPPSNTAPSLVELACTPLQAIVFAPENQLQVQVTATFSDGSRRDVTQRACYELSNLSAEVDADGRVTRGEYGETTLIVRYLQQQVPVSIAFVEARPGFKWSGPLELNFVDAHVFSKLRRMSINPSPPCSDGEFVRRAYLDLAGRGPTQEEAQSFVYSARLDKRSQLIDDLLARTEFADFWAMKWADILRAEEKVLDPTGVERFHAWIRESILAARPIDEFVAELVTGVGSTFEKPAANYYRANRDPETRGETTARLFLGTRLQCAKCHNHPFDHWTQADYYQWSSLFSQLDYEIGENNRTDRLDKNEFVGDQVVLVSKQTEVVNPTTGEVAEPKFLGGQLLAKVDWDDRLGALATWLTSPDNELFAKSQTNFIWYHLMGQGLVDPIDDFRLTNPASNPALLDALSAHFVAHDFDLRELVRTIMNSQTYQLSSEPNETNGNDSTCYSRNLVRRLPAEVILDMQSDLLDLPASFVGFPAGVRAVQIPGVHRKPPRKEAPASGDRFLMTFGKPERIMACECERTNETTLKQVFVLVGDGLNARLETRGGRLQRLIEATASESEVVDSLYWSAISRPPNDTEREAALQLIRSYNDNRAAAIEDIAWALMNTKEFLFRK